MACFVRLPWAQTGFSKWNTVKALKVLALVMFMRVSSFIFKVTRWAAFKVRGCHTKNKSKAKCARWPLFLWICVALYTGRERERACGNSSNYEIGTLNYQSSVTSSGNLQLLFTSRRVRVMLYKFWVIRSSCLQRLPLLAVKNALEKHFSSCMWKDILLTMIEGHFNLLQLAIFGYT